MTFQQAFNNLITKIQNNFTFLNNKIDNITVDQSFDGTSTDAQSGVAVAGELANYVTKSADQNITGTKTFVGQKKIGFKQSSSSDKLGFTLYNNSGTEKGYLEYNPSNTVDNVPLMTLGNYASASGGLTHVGFRKYSSVSGASGAYNLLAPLVADARTPFNLTTTYTNFYLPLGITDGNTTLKTAKSGLLDISTFLSDFVSTGSLATTLSNYVLSSSLSTVATSGSYNDLTNKPTIPDAQVQADWNVTDTTSKAFIKNKPNIPSGVVVDQTYDGTSANAQSGVAIAGAGFLKNISNTPASNLQIGTSPACNSATLSNTVVIGNNIGVGDTNCSNAILIGSTSNGVCFSGNSISNSVTVFLNNETYKLLDVTTGLIPDARLSSNIARTSQIPSVSYDSTTQTLTIE